MLEMFKKWDSERQLSIVTLSYVWLVIRALYEYIIYRTLWLTPSLFQYLSQAQAKNPNSTDWTQG